MSRLINTKDTKPESVLPKSQSILVYGDTKTGKTRFVATAAKLPQIKKIVWIDAENGYQTLLNMGLTEEELAKFIIIHLKDTKNNPIAIETTLKMFTSPVPVKICDKHSVVNCDECLKAGRPYEVFDLKSMTMEDMVVLDSGSQVGASALNAATKGKDILYKLQLDDYGAAGKLLSDLFTTIQQIAHTIPVVITHTTVIKGEDHVERTYPLVGTSNFSQNVGKYFGTVINTHVKLGKHSGASSSTFKPNLITGSRLNIKLEASADPTMKDVLIAGGIIK